MSGTPTAGAMPAVHDATVFFTAAPAARAEAAIEATANYPLGVARGQVAATYIVAETADGLILVDQHAAHERLVLERMRGMKAMSGDDTETLEDILAELFGTDDAA